MALTVDAVPVEFTDPLEESTLATASCSLPAAFDVAVAVSEAITADRPELGVLETVLEALLRRLVVTFEVVPPCDELAVPVPPVDPELPLMATGFEIAVDVAGPVLPVLVALDEEFTAPESPDWATGAITTLGAPPEPPFALPVLVESPPASVTPAAAGPRRATAAAATPVAPAMQIPPVSRAFLEVVIGRNPRLSVVLAGVAHARARPSTNRTKL
ncbi:MAG: hypothetical protein JO085_05905, partial [Acidimicrobiia bacterium]|nr:hypothetical protein [Acidimicrobiia bacterium]